MVIVNITQLMLPSYTLYFASSILCYFIMILSLRSKSKFALHFNIILFAKYWLNFTVMLKQATILMVIQHITCVFSGQKTV